MDKVRPIDLRELFTPIRRHWKIAAIAFASVVITVTFLTLTSARVYEASAMLSIRQGGDVQDQLLNIPSVFYQKYLVKNQVAILESRTLAANVIKRLQESSHRDSLSILASQNESSILRKIRLWSTQNDVSRKKPSFKTLVNRFRSSAKVAYGHDTDIIELKGRAPTPREAAFIVNTWVDAYQAYNRSDSQSEVKQTRRFLEKKLEEMERKLVFSEKRLAEYKKDENVVSLPDETEQLVMQLASFEFLYNETRTELEASENQLAYLKGQLDESKRSLVEDMTKLSSPGLQELQKTMAEWVARRAAFEAQLLGEGFSIEKSSQLKQMENRISGLKEKIVEETKKLITKDLTHVNPLDYSENLITQILEIETTCESLRAKTTTLQAIVDEYTARLEALPDKNLSLARLERDVQVNSKLYIMLREKYEETRIQEAGLLGIVRIVDMAEPLNEPVHPNVPLNLLLSLFFGILFALGLVFVRDYFETSVRDEEDLKAMHLSILGEIPVMEIERLRLPRGRKQNDWILHRARSIFPYLLTQRNGNTTIVEAYRAIRTSIYYSVRREHWKTILFTSPGPADGKSTTAANLAITMAQKGVKTLLVDSDLRRPVLDVLFIGTHRKVGLTNHLGREVEWRDAVRETTVEGLHLLTAGVGVTNTSEILSSKRMFSLIEEVKKEYGIVILDSPPLLPVTDAVVLATLVDSVVLVVKAGKTSREGVKRSMDLLGKVGARVLGSVLTGVEYSGLYAYRDYYCSYAETVEKEV